MEKRLKKLIALSLMLVFVVAMLAGCKPKVETSVPVDKTLVIAQGVDATMLDPNMHSETPTGNLANQIYDRLIGRDSNMEFEPALALSWKPLSDTVWEIKLRQGVLFHDGKGLTAVDVKYTIDRIQDPAKKSSQAGNLSMIKEVEVVDPHTLKIHTKAPFPILPARLSNLRVVPKHYVEAVGDEAFRTKPMGSGPYELVQWVKDEHVTLKANENYWGGAPAIKKVVFKPIPEPASRVMALQSGEVDIIVNVPPHQVAAVNNSGKASAVSVPSIRAIFIPFIPQQGKPLYDAAVRQAVNMAVDVQGIINSLLEGNGTQLTQALANTEFGYDPSLKAYGFDVAKAKEMLAAAGYPQGFKVKMLAPSGRYMMDKEVAEAVKNQLEAIGLEVDLQILEWGVYVEKLMARTLNADMFLIGWSSGIYDADGTLFSWFRSGQRFGYYQVGKEREDEMDALLDTARTILDQAKREELYHQALGIIYKDAPWIPLYQQMDIYGVGNRVKWTPRSDEAIVVFEMSWK